MAGKAPLLLASVLFAVGAVGLALTSAERASWGPFEPRHGAQNVVVLDMSGPSMEPPSLVELTTLPETAVASEGPQLLVAAPEPVSESAPEEPTPTPVPPLRIFGISSDDGGVSAAGATPSPPPPIRIGGIAFDEETSTETPEATATPGETENAVGAETPEATETPEASDTTEDLEAGDPATSAQTPDAGLEQDGEPDSKVRGPKVALPNGRNPKHPIDHVRTSPESPGRRG